MQVVYDWITNAFEPVLRFWENPRTEKVVAWSLVAIFLAGLAGIELKRRGLLPPHLAAVTPDSHYHAVNLAFTLVLVIEVLGLIFVLPCSFSKSMGKQFEILSLILLRNAFKELVNLPEPLHPGMDPTPILRIVVTGAGALAIFAIQGYAYRLHDPKARLVKDSASRYAFVAVKKLVALVLMGIFAWLAAASLREWFITGAHSFDFFDTFYTVLIFADVLLVLVAQRFLPGYRAVFRNSGYALATLLIRLGLASPPYYDVALGLTAAVFALALTMTFNAFYADPPQPKET